ncbi:hypothetical protein BOTBODRAFT_37602 [Botryobasidium botryosum FD-172 SS1]|uniref:Methyltransferase n=1 Tax=Botryobasidium botryosum (strain FD-172 SS1) TaxID=930990 RepID=A0A067MAV8_BOTB1|nr:hypothetical protein BOTBODRAFT_37602 [Botryobasidium botryosum FD-172 SS1]
MATAAVLTPGDVQTILNYSTTDPSGEAPYFYVESPPAGQPRSNLHEDAHDAVIHNARGLENQFSMDTSGFEFVKHTSTETDFLDEEAIKTRYYGEVEELLKKHTGAKRVFIFDHTIRRNYDGKTGTELRGPVTRAHVDQTFDAGFARVHYHLGDEAERLLKGRVRIINVWRPIGAPVYHDPLAVADWRSVSVDKDLIPVRFIYPHREGSIFHVRHSENLKWYYLKEQTPSEVTLIKCFDSATDGRARLTPHSAFHDAGSPPEAPKRQSIEVRALVFDAE